MHDAQQSLVSTQKARSENMHCCASSWRFEPRWPWELRQLKFFIIIIIIKTKNALKWLNLEEMKHKTVHSKREHRLRLQRKKQYCTLNLVRWYLTIAKGLCALSSCRSRATVAAWTLIVNGPTSETFAAIVHLRSACRKFLRTYIWSTCNMVCM